MNKLPKKSKKLVKHVYLLLTSFACLYPIITNAALTFSINSHISAGTFQALLLDVLNVFIIIATPIIVLYIIYAGFLYVTARGNVQQTQQATRALMYAIVGGVIVLGAVALAEIVKNVVDSFTTP